jgi:hypothetical protein
MGLSVVTSMAVLAATDVKERKKVCGSSMAKWKTMEGEGTGANRGEAVL